MRVFNFGELGTFERGNNWAKQIADSWPWICALDAFDFGATKRLSDLVASRDIPAELRPALARIISGDRKPNAKRGSKLKVPAECRMAIAGAISQALGEIDDVEFGRLRDLSKFDTFEEARILEAMADSLRQEPNDIRNYLNDVRRNVIERSAEALGVSIETVENMLRDLRKKIENYPDV